MRSRLLPVLAAGALSITLPLTVIGPAPTAGAADAVGAVQAPEAVLPAPAAATAAEPPQGTPAEQASAVLDEALELGEPLTAAEARQREAEGGADATAVLNQLVRVRSELGPGERAKADRLLARPDDASGAPYIDYGDAPQDHTCGPNVCVHWVTDPEDPNAPDLSSDDTDDVPDSVEQVLDTAESVHRTYRQAGFRAPDPDRKGPGDGLVDIYLGELGAQRIYGYCTVDSLRLTRPTNRAAYCALDDDFAEFDSDPVETMQVTLAHEYFHAVQFAYDYFEDFWIMEATATWAEDELFDDVDDNRQYLPESQLVTSWSPLDRFNGNRSFQYGNWIFVRYLSERWPAAQGGLPVIVRNVWEQLSGRRGAPDLYSTQALQQVLARRGTSFTSVYGQFADANRLPARTYDEGAAYPVAAPAGTWRLSTSRRATRPLFTRLDHLTSVPLRFRPAPGLTARGWRLQLTVDMPDKVTAPVARVAVHQRDGKVKRSTIRLRANGAGQKVVPFSARGVQYVELVLVNASRRMRGCQTAGDVANYFACFGRSRDDDRRTDFRARIVRR